MKASRALDADITLVCGQSGSGKTSQVMKRTRDDRRVIVWDVKGEFAELKGFAALSSAAELARTLSTMQAGRVAFVPRSLSLFDHWCNAAYAWGHCTVIAEELADVTTPGKAPPGWGVVVRRGRARGLRIFGITQRPSESDKTILGNVTRIIVCAMARADDRRYMARELDVPQSAVDGLRIDALEYLEKNARTREILRGSLKTGRVGPYTGRASGT